MCKSWWSYPYLILHNQWYDLLWCQKDQIPGVFRSTISGVKMCNNLRWKTSVSIQIFSVRSSVKWPDRAKTNFTSIALIKAQPRCCKNNHMGTALLRSEIRGGIESFHAVSCPMALACLHFSSYMDGLHKRHFLFPLNIKIMQSNMTKTSLPF